jgi:tetratricopeptide (TPR) repeat protein
VGATVSGRQRSAEVFSAGGFVDHLRPLIRGAVTGRVDVDNGAFLTHFWLESGQVRAVASEAEEEKLGHWLVSRGCLDEGEMVVGLLRRPASVRFGNFLVNQGLLTPDRLETELAALSIGIVSRLVGEPGELWLQRDEQLDRDAVTLSMTTASLLAAAARVSPDLHWIVRMVRPDLFPAASADVMLQLQSVHLTPQEGYLLSRVDGQTAVAALGHMVPMAWEGFLHSLAALVVSGLVELHETRARHRTPAGSLTERALDGNARPNPMLDELSFGSLERREYDETIRYAERCRHLDFYSRLGLPKTAGIDQINSRYRALMRTFHPDRARERHLRTLQAELGEICRGLDEACEVLRDPERRARYDRSLDTPSPQERQAGGHGEAGEDRRKALARDSLGEARRLLALGEHNDAAALLEQSVRLFPEPEALLLLARIELPNPMLLQRAVDRLRLAVAINPQFTEGWLELARVWGERGHPDRQKRCLESVLAYDPDNAACRAANAPTGEAREGEATETP